MGGKKMADEKKQDKIDREDILKALVETLMKGGSSQQSGIDMNALMTIMTTLMRGGEGGEKGVERGSMDALIPLLLMQQTQQKSGTLDNLMQMFMVSKLIDQMTQKEEDDLTKAFKFKMMMQMMEGGKKESAIDDYIKLMQVINPSRASEIEKLKEELLRMNETNQKSIEEIKKANEEMKRTSETNLSQLRNEILTLYKDLSTPQQSSSFAEEMKKQLEFQRQVREYAEAMGWIKAMGLPSTNEDWQPDDYLAVINKIAETATNVVGAMTGMRATGKKERAPAVQKIPEVPQVQEQPAPQPSPQPQPQPSPQPQSQPAPAPKEEKKIDPEVEEYIKNMQVTDSGFIDQYGNSYIVQEGKPDYNAFKQWAYENPDQIKDLMERSKQEYERSLAKQKQSIANE